MLYLNAGDTYTGTAWFTIYKWKIAAEFINALQPDAVVSTESFNLYIYMNQNKIGPIVIFNYKSKIIIYCSLIYIN